MTELDLLVSAAFGMEAIVVRELRDLGYENASIDNGRVRFRADISAICRTNLWLRCAERVQVVVADFAARNFDELFDQVKVLPWEQWLPVDAKFPVTARCVRSEIRSVPNTQKMVKRAIVERLRKVYSRHWFEESGNEYPVDVSVLGDRALLTIDTTGDGLHKRGYRNLVGRAPLRETVAAALVKLSYWNRDRLLVDPFCGSGTIPIEAAMIARNLAPGRNRHFKAETWKQIPQSVWTQARTEVKDLEDRRPLSIPIIATDRDRAAIKMAKQHARQAGVANEIHFEVKDFVAFPTNREAGILICNPPYGERLGDRAEVQQLYADMGELLRPLTDWSLYILTAAEGFERYFGKRADRRRKLYNARYACTFYQYLGPKPAGHQSGEDESPSTDQLQMDRIDSEEASQGMPATSPVPATSAAKSPPVTESRSSEEKPSEQDSPAPASQPPVSSAPSPVSEAPETPRSLIDYARLQERPARPVEESVSRQKRESSSSQPLINPWTKRPYEEKDLPQPPVVDQPTSEQSDAEDASGRPDDQAPEEGVKQDQATREQTEQTPAEQKTVEQVAQDQATQEESSSGGTAQKPSASAPHPWKKRPWPKAP